MAQGIKKISENVIASNRALVITNKSEVDNRAISIGALWSDSGDKSLKIKTGLNTFSYFDAKKLVMPATISTNLLEDKCVTDIKLADNSVIERTIAVQAVSSSKIKDLSVIETKIGTQAVTSSKIKDSNILTRHLEQNCVTGPKIASKTITGEHIQDQSLNNINFASDSVNSRVIASKSILTTHYSDKSIENTALQDSCVFGRVIKDLGVEAKHLSNNSVVTRVIANGAVDGSKITDKAIMSKHLNDACVGSKHLSISCVLEKNLGTDSVGTSKIKDNSVTKVKLAKDVVDLIGNPVQYDQNNNVTLKNDLKVNGNVEVVGNIRAEKIFNAVFMDLAEAYEPEKDTVCIPGDIMQVNENGKVVKASPSSHFPIVGVVSDEYAACYGATEDELLLNDKVAIGLIGKVHVNVIGPVKLGDKIAVAKDGTGASCNTNNLLQDHIIGKALESNDEIGLKKVLCLIYPR